MESGKLKTGVIVESKVARYHERTEFPSTIARNISEELKEKGFMVELKPIQRK